MPEVREEQLQQIFCPNLPLAIYREVAAHLRQIEGVEAGLLPQTDAEFGYLQSQAGGLWIRGAASLPPDGQQRIAQILTYYGDRYGKWQDLAADKKSI